MSSLSTNLSKPTSFFGLQLWIFILICIIIFTLLLLLSLALYILYHRHKKPHILLSKPSLSKNICTTFSASSSLSNVSEIEMKVKKPPEEHPVVISDQWSEKESGTTAGTVGRNLSDFESVSGFPVVITDIRIGNRFTMREIEVATNGLADDNLIGNGDFGVVYCGILLDNTQVAVKKLRLNSCQAEDFKKEVESIGQVRHKNLVKLLGYCIEGAYRMLVSEYIDNGNLHQWLHHCAGQISPLTWAIRMNIILGTAKGLAYLHEDVEPKIVHQGIKSSNILLDHQWNPKISDFGLARLFGHEGSHVKTRAMRKNDMYSFGILLMEIISGRIPIDYSRPQEEVYLIDWLKSMVANQKFYSALDPKISQQPSSKELKRVLLIALRCVDPDAKNRPKMGDVIHMLQPCDLLLSDQLRIRRETSRLNDPQESQAVEKLEEGTFGTNEGESGSNLC